LVVEAEFAAGSGFDQKTGVDLEPNARAGVTRALGGGRVIGPGRPGRPAHAAESLQVLIGAVRGAHHAPGMEDRSEEEQADEEEEEHWHGQEDC
jgi:hypothetical protein